jgi:hypothetical protein
MAQKSMKVPFSAGRNNMHRFDRGLPPVIPRQDQQRDMRARTVDRAKVKQGRKTARRNRRKRA